MTYLQRIAEIVTETGKNKVDVIHFGALHNEEENMHEQAYNLLFEGIAPDDKKRDNYPLYEMGSVAFRKFLSRFRRKVYNMLLLTDVSGTRISPALKAEIACGRMVLMVRILTVLYARRAGVDMAKKILRQSEKFIFPDFALISLKVLRKEMSETGMKKELAEMHKQTDFWMAQMMAEDKANRYMELIEVPFGRSISQKPELAQVAFDYVKKIEKDIEKHDSYTLQYYKHRIEAAGHENAKEYRKCIKSWNAWKTYLELNPDYASDTRYGEVAIHKLNYYMHLHQYSSGRRCAEQCLKHFWPGNTTRLVFMEPYFLFNMQTGQYTKAAEIYADTKKDKHFVELHDTNKEKWVIFNAYNIYALNEKSAIRKFDLKGFSKDTKVFSPDKKGFNAAKIIIGCCMLLRKGNTTGLIDLRWALKEYRLRYLGTEPGSRVNVFFNMLYTADLMGYDFEKTVAATKDDLALLKDAPYHYDGNMEGLEIIPFETLWQMFIGDMK